MHGIDVFIAKYFIVLALLVTLAAWLQLNAKHKKQFIIVVVVGGIVTYALAKLGGALFYDTRPFVAGHFTPYFSHAADNGFPSDHTLLASLLAFATLAYKRSYGVILFVIALLIGFSRVVAGVHHVIDIIGAIVCAALGTAAAYYLLKLIDSRTAAKKNE